MSPLEDEVKQLIIDALQLEDISVSDIDTDAPLFIEGLALDSIDALELGVAIHKKYHIQFSKDPADTTKHFASVRNLAAWIASSRGARP